MPPSRWAKLMAPPVAIIVFDGMQSHRCAAPPTMSRSIIVTCAPCRAACVAAVLPAGPAPMMTNRTLTAAGYFRGPGSGGRAGRAWAEGGRVGRARYSPSLGSCIDGADDGGSDCARAPAAAATGFGQYLEG